MADHEGTATMRTIRFHGYGDAADVLHLEEVAVPDPGPGRIRVAVHACGLNPADWHLCTGFAAGLLPRGIGLEVSGTVEAVGEGVTDVAIGDAVLGTPDWSRETSAGAADRAIVEHWAEVPAGLDLTAAAALPMAAVTADHGLEVLGVEAGHTVLIHGAGTTVGFAAVQLALLRGARVIATAGGTYAGRLRDFGAAVTPYGEGMVERVRDVAGAPVDLVLDTAPPSDVLPDLVGIADGDAQRIVTVTDHENAAGLGVRSNLRAGVRPRHEMLGEFARLASEGRLTVPVAGAHDLEDWRTPMDLSRTGHARGKLLLMPSGA